MDTTFATQFLLSLPALLAISAIVTWMVESLKPTVTKLGLSDTLYGIALRVIAAVLGVVIAGLLGNPNIFAGITFYGSEINPLVGMLATAVLTSAGANALHEIGEYLGLRPVTVAATDSTVTVAAKGDGSDTPAIVAQSRSKPYKR